ncbi:hypothetical protein AB0H71_13910 [Nocardia sp. NPDC050697]|uniref:hypothetical protein n=1 Tax=Nocardia sp. NPDC050697 TaxID=3155158 RepID=UPI0034114A39
MTAVQFNDAERALLRRCHILIGPVIASPEWAVRHLRDHAERSGGGGGFAYEVGTGSIHGTWHEWIETDWNPDGSAKLWREGALLGEARVSFARLERWAAGLPSGVRAMARRWWATYPRNTRDLPRLAALTVAVVDGRYEREPEHEASPAGDQFVLDLGVAG